MSAPDVSGRWVNQNGSSVELVANAQGGLSGHYVSRKGRAASGKAYPLIGQVNGGVLAFQVSWQDAGDNLSSITSFTGRIGQNADGIDCIHTMWVLARQFENEERTRPTGFWNAFLTNSDVFTREG